MYELAEYIIANLVDGDAKYSITYNDKTGDLVILVAKESIGKVIGKQGRIAKAIRLIIKAAAIKNDLRVNVEIKELVEE